MKKHHIHSSVISSIGYDSKKHMLEVEFLQTGELYQYFDVPMKEYERLMQLSLEDESVGAYFNSEFKKKYKHYKHVH